MPEVWLYTVGVNSDPDSLECKVPLEIDDEFIFFGPCMRRMREDLRGLHLGRDIHRRIIRTDHVIVGVNAAYKDASGNRIRKIIWAGKLIEVMTFADAWRRLAAARFRNLRKDRESPLLVRPILGGYKHISQLHEEEENGKRHKKWVYDLTSAPENLGVHVRRNKVLLRDGVSAWHGFDRDCCLLLRRISFANGKEEGIKIDDTGLAILREAQPGRGVNKYAIFGKARNGKANGLRNNYRSLEGKLAERFIAWLSKQARQGQKKSVRGHAPTMANARPSC